MKILAMTCAIGVLACLSAPPAFAASSCDSLAALALKDTTITQAQLVPAGQFSAPGQAAGRGANPYAGLPEFCRVAATIKPTSDSDIKVEVWLPATGWNGKFQAVGNGGWAGVISYSAMADAVRAGYASASTDTGHVGGSGSFALGHPEKLIDFGWRSEHEMTVKAKAIIQAFYGNAPRLSYWNGCSTGGRQGLKEAQKFPDDYDGIIAGAPANRTAISVVDCPRGTEGPGQLHPAREVSGHPPGRPCRLRQPRRAQGRPHRRPHQVRVRSRKCCSARARTVLAA